MQGIIITDPGHGGIDPKTGKYTTSPDKMFKHSRGEFHGDGWFYEGVQNRRAEQILHDILCSKGIPFISTVPKYKKPEDVPIWRRVQLEHSLNSIMPTFFLSIHFNATKSHKATGTSVWTSRGQTGSDPWASKIFKNVKKRLGDKIDYLSDDWRDGDPDFEADFAVCKWTKSNAVLLEILFFDNYKDAILAMDDCFLIDYMSAVAEVLEEWYFNTQRIR